MKRTTKTSLVAMIALALPASASTFANAQSAQPVNLRAPGSTTKVPDAIAAAADEKVAFVYHAEGWQYYECKANAAGAIAWVFTSPEAIMFNQYGNFAGWHGAGPFWSAKDGASIVGTVRTRMDAPDPSADIPWLILNAKPQQGQGKMTPIVAVQRINTKGGVAPKKGCASPTDVGRKSAEDYAADYVFLSRKS